MQARIRAWHSRSILWKCNLFSCLPSPLASTEIESQQANPVLRRARGTSHQSRGKSVRRRERRRFCNCAQKGKRLEISAFTLAVCGRAALSRLHSSGWANQRDGEMLKCEADSSDWLRECDVRKRRRCGTYRFIEACDWGSHKAHTHIYIHLSLYYLASVHVGCAALLATWDAWIIGGLPAEPQIMTLHAAFFSISHQEAAAAASQPALCAMPTRPKTLVRDALVAGASTPTHPFPSCTPLLICRANLPRSQRSTLCTAALLYIRLHERLRLQMWPRAFCHPLRDRFPITPNFIITLSVIKACSPNSSEF